jgi:hypothetical protein
MILERTMARRLSTPQRDREIRRLREQALSVSEIGHRLGAREFRALLKQLEEPDFNFLLSIGTLQTQTRVLAVYVVSSGTDAARTGKSGDGGDEVDEKDDEIAHFGIAARKLGIHGIPGKLAIRHASWQSWVFRHDPAILGGFQHHMKNHRVPLCRASWGTLVTESY